MNPDEFPHFEIELRSECATLFHNSFRQLWPLDYKHGDVQRKTNRAIRKQLTDTKSGLTNREASRTMQGLINALERMFNLGQFSPVLPVEEIANAKKLRQQRKSCDRLGKKNDAN